MSIGSFFIGEKTVSDEVFETLTDSGGSPEAGDSSSPDPSTGELFETMDVESSETLPTEEQIQEEAAKEETLPEETKAKETETQEKPKETPEETAKPEEKPEETDKLEPFHKHPRFQEMNKTIKELKSQVEQLTAKPAEETTEDLGYKDITKLSPEEIQDWQDEDPVGWAKNLLMQAKAEARSDIHAEAQQNTMRAAADKTLDDFVKAHPDFDEVYESRALSKYCDEHPGHNIISAYLAISEGKAKEAHGKEVENLKASFEAEKKAAIDAAVKEAVEKIQKQHRAKESVTVITGDTTSPTVENEDTDTGGDLTKFLHRQMIKETTA
jgi:uncharacterized protein YcbK (DUF882 family)